MKVKKYLAVMALSVSILTACAGKGSAVEQKINDHEGSLFYSVENVKETQLAVNSQAEQKEGKRLDFEKAGEDMYVGIYTYDGGTYTIGYAKNCDFKEYLLLPEIQSAEAAQIGGMDYQVAYYSDNGKAAYYYIDENTCIYVYTDTEMENEEFKKHVEELNVHMDGEA